jgi:hypothetical protein
MWGLGYVRTAVALGFSCAQPSSLVRELHFGVSQHDIETSRPSSRIGKFRSG